MIEITYRQYNTGPPGVSVSESLGGATVDFRNFIVFFVGPRPWHIEIRHRVKKKNIHH